MDILLPGSTTASTDENTINNNAQSWLEGKGHTVTRIQSTAAPPGDVGDYDLIFFGAHRSIDGSIDSGWVTVAVPLLLARSENLGGDASIVLKFFSGTAGSDFTDAMNVTNDTHEIPVALGLSTGSLVIATANSTFPRGEAGAVTAEGTVLATVAGTVCWAVYDEGAEMNDAQVAPARRSIWTFPSAHADNIGRLNTDGEGVLTETMDWTANLATTQLLTVDSVVHVGNWTDDAGSSVAADLATAIGGETATDSTFAQSEESPSSSPMVWKFSDGQTPGDATEPHTVTVRIKKDTTGGDQIDLTLELREGYTDEGTPGTLIASESFTDLTDTIAESTLTLSQAEAESVNDWTDLYGRVVANVGP